MALLTDQPGTADSIQEDYFTRESGDDSVVVYLHLDAVDGIARDIAEGSGVEVGGLLLGHVEPGDRPRVWIDRYQRLEDLLEIEQAAAAIHQSSDLNIVGFYRSHTHAGFQLEESDFELIARYFSDPGDLILLLRTGSVATISAQFFARDAAGEVRPSGAEFPFRGRVLGALAGDPIPAAPDKPDGPAPREGFRRLVPDFGPIEDQGRPARAFMSESIPAEALPAPFSHRDESGIASTRKRARRWWPFACAILLVAGAASILLPRVDRREATPVPDNASPEAGASVRPLGLYVDPSGSAWRISWNRDATALRGARGVRLFVRDSDDQNRIDLSPQDLQSGTYQYQPKGQDVTLRLEVTDNSGHLAAESFRVLKSAPAAPVVVKPAAPRSNTVPPHATRQVPPTVPASIRPRIKDPIPIDVWVKVDVHGKVTEAVPVAKPHSGLGAYLAKSAVAAAKQWRFDPAREDGKPVPGTEKIHFVFER
jgi:hypothetical protein